MIDKVIVPAPWTPPDQITGKYHVGPEGSTVMEQGRVVEIDYERGAHEVEIPVWMAKKVIAAALGASDE